MCENQLWILQEYGDVLPRREVLHTMKKGRELESFVRATFLKTVIQNVFDLHYLFCREEEIKVAMNKMLRVLVGEEEKGEWEHVVGERRAKEVKDAVVMAKQKLEEIKGSVSLWRENNFVPDMGIIERNQNIIKTKWREYARKKRERMLMRIAGKKKNVYKNEQNLRRQEKGDKIPTWIKL